MNLITPDLGTIFWMTIAFGTVFFILAKFAWKPILAALKEREEGIENALKAADSAKEEMKNLRAKNDQIIQEAKQERDAVLKEARELKDKIITEAKKQASLEASKIIESSKQAFELEKEAAVKELKNQVAELSVSIANKILKKEVEKQGAQDELVETYLEELKLN